MSSRDQILSDIRGVPLSEVELPDLDQESWIQYEDLTQQFSVMLAAVGGNAICCPRSELAHQLELLEPFRQASQRCSLVEEIPGQVALHDIEDPHELEQIDFFLMWGRFGVAENGAIWMSDPQLKHRVAPFITQHLAIVLNEHDLVHNMHEAYSRLQLGEKQYGAFISGPSKTADIEQSLVIGAHGARSLTAFLVK